MFRSQLFTPAVIRMCRSNSVKNKFTKKSYFKERGKNESSSSDEDLVLVVFSKELGQRGSVSPRGGVETVPQPVSDLF